MVVHEADKWPWPQYTQLTLVVVGVESLAISAAAVGVRVCIFREESEIFKRDARSLASISCSKIFITSSRFHLSLIVARLTISLTSDGSLFTRIDVSSPPYESGGTPRARSLLT